MKSYLGQLAKLREMPASGEKDKNLKTVDIKFFDIAAAADGLLEDYAKDADELADPKEDRKESGPAAAKLVNKAGHCQKLISQICAKCVEDEASTIGLEPNARLNGYKTKADERSNTIKRCSLVAYLNDACYGWEMMDPFVRSFLVSDN